MQLEGSCHCGAVRFSVNSVSPYPYQRCYCSICRKTQGGGGYAINIAADATTMKITGGTDVSVYRVMIREPDSDESAPSSAARHFCKNCGSALWIFSPEWPELIYPFASAVDTELPVPPERTHLFLDSKASWVETEAHANDKLFPAYPEESIAEWHERLGLTAE